MNVRPCTLKQANEYVKLFHRHSKRVVGCKFSICAYKNNKLVGVAIVGRPVARKLDDGITGEILRTCTIFGQNVAKVKKDNKREWCRDSCRDFEIYPSK